MANLYTNKIISLDYGNLAELTGLSFTNGTKYNGQINGGMAILREGSTGRGFIVEDGDSFDFTYGGDTIYIKTNGNGVVLNLAN